jgi:hypothetical protein
MRADNCLKHPAFSDGLTENILRLIHPDDLHEKYLQELRFLHWISRLPEKNRKDYYLSSRLRMRDASGNYQPALHRMFYVPAP